MLTEDSAAIDATAGQILRALRKVKGLSQAELGRSADITFQQVQKYETGANRISISRLFQLCAALEVDPCRFVAEVCARSGSGVGASVLPAELEFLASPTGRRAVSAMASLDSPAMLEAVTDLLSAVEQNRCCQARAAKG